MLNKNYVVAIGAANMDINCSTNHVLVAGDSTPGLVRYAAGGVARNVAENLARLGHAVVFLSAVGDDAGGSALLEHTQRAGVDTSNCWTVAGAATSSYMSLHGADGDMAFAINDMAILDQITPALLAGQSQKLLHASALLVDCNLSEAALEWLFTYAHDTPVFVDPVSAFKCPRLAPWLHRVHTLKANRLEAQTLWGQAVDSDADVEQAARWLHAQGVQRVVLSLGERGVYWSAHDGASGWQEAIPVAVVNATGAGDALLAGLMHGYLQGLPLQQGVAFAVGCAALTLTATQANHPDLSVEAVRHLIGSD